MQQSEWNQTSVLSQHRSTCWSQRGGTRRGRQLRPHAATHSITEATTQQDEHLRPPPYYIYTNGAMYVTTNSWKPLELMIPARPYVSEM